MLFEVTVYVLHQSAPWGDELGAQVISTEVPGLYDFNYDIDTSVKIKLQVQ